MSKKNVKNSRVSGDQFVRVVCEIASGGGTVEDAANKLGMRVSSVSTRMSNYRKKGVNLPKFPRGGNGIKLDVDTLNKLVVEHSK